MSDETGLIALHKAAEDFAGELTATLGGVLPHAPRFHAIRTGRKLWVTTVSGDESEPVQSRIELHINGEPELTLAISYYCCWDQAGEFLAVDKSTVAMHYRQDPEPLLRYEYVRTWTWPPGAHMHVHAHHNQISWLQRLSDTGKPGRLTQQKRRPGLAELHFPVGGHRMRPSLEDILMMIVREFDVDTVTDWERVLTDGIHRWRDKQLRSAVRDAPDQAVQVLRSLGYEVTEPAETTTTPHSKLYLP
ncbi:hypothetical protein [Streptomyces mirabilis]|uniref:hypothetical protein n=1 Tax=Streptomyces mirabilis TaxID=68239 RepID=UPI0022506582|nr:hypothetical protein [Streptomyces mirabilis]MCX4430246.1 hypothetical protein [Streptomyces mirabilis]